MLRRARRRLKNCSVRPNLEVLEDRLTPSLLLGQQPGAPDTTQFHGDAARTGFNQNETFLTPTNVASSFGQVWQSPVLDGHLYASPVYQDTILIRGNGNAANHAGDGVQSASFQGKTLGVVFAATGGGTVYALAAQDTNGTTGVAPGTILWKTHLGNPYGGIDGNSIGVLSTPIIDRASGRLYVTGSVTDYLLPAGNPNHGGNNWEVFALNLSDGSLVSGWPLAFTQSLLDSLNRNTLNGPNAVPFSSGGADQRGALALNPDGSTLYVDFACYGASNPGWMTTVATGVTNGTSNGQTPAVVSAYSANDSTTTSANGGMWGAGGPSVDANGNVFVSTGDSPNGTGQTPGAWGNSVLEWGPGQTLTLIGAYSPWNYQTQDTIDSDLGGGSPILINLPAGSSTTTELLAVGGKQGNGYLVDAGNNLNNPTRNPTSPAPYPASLTMRPPVVNPNQDPSLYDPNAIRSYFNPPQAGPLALFQPYNETSASGNTAKARDTPATFTAPDGTHYVIWAGSSKAAVGSGTPVAPSLYLTKVVAAPGQPAFLQIVAQNTQVMSLAGANIITANGTSTPIDWIVDAGVQRTDGLTSFANGAPTLYAYNALTLQPFWSSSYEQLDLGGKYNTIAARGNVFVGTDRIQAFGLTSDTIVDDSVQGTGPNQFTYTGSGWTHTPAGTSTSTMGTFDGTVSTDNVAGDSATLTFTGSQVKVFANEAAGYGSVLISVDGGNAQTVSLANTTNSPNGQGEGDVLVYTLAGLGAGAHTLQLRNTGFSFISARILGNDTVEFQSNNGGGAASIDNTKPTGTITTGDWLDLIFTAQETASGSFKGTFALVDYGPTGVGAGTTVLAPVSWTIAGLTNLGTASAVSAGFRTATAASFTGHVQFDNFAVDPPPAAKLAYLQQPSTGTAGAPLGPFVVAVEDIAGHTVSTDSSTVTLTLRHGTFANGATFVTAAAVNGVATFRNLVINVPGSYVLRATDTNPNLDPGYAPFTINAAGASKLAFVQQPSNATAGATISPAVTVAVEDANGNTVTGDTSTVTLTLSSGTFAGGSNTVSTAAVNGVATFSSLVINTAGSYTLAAGDGSLTGATSNAFTISAGSAIFVDFNAGAATFTSNFKVYNHGGANTTSLAWGATSGVNDQAGGAAGGGVQSSASVAIDSTAVYTPSTVNLSDGVVHTISEYVTAVAGLGTGDKSLQIGYLAPTSTGFNTGFTFISARILGNDTVEFQSANGGGAVSTNNTKPTGTITTGDWLKLIFTTQETASGSFKGTFALVDYGPTGVGSGTTVLAPVSYSVTGLTGLGTASAVAPGFRTALPASFTGHVRFDNFADPSSATNVLQYHNDLASTGQNLNETTLTTGNVNSGSFGKQFSTPVDGQVYAQPLFLSGVSIAGGTHNVVFVATEHDSVYALDADTGAVLWQKNYLQAGERTLTTSDVGTSDLSPQIGITGTPVIDSSSGTIYFVTKATTAPSGTNASTSNTVQRLHAVDITTGNEKFGGPVVIAASVNGTGVGNDGNGHVPFDALRNNQRMGLILENGVVYITWSSHGDNGPYHGWVIGYNASTLQQTAVFNDTPNGSDGGIWEGGGAVSVDSSGNFYLTTGNGTFDTTLDSSGMPNQHDFGDSVLKLAVDPNSSSTNQNGNGWGLKVIDYFTPDNQASLNSSDTDLGSGDALLLPDSAGSTAHPHLLVVAGKAGETYLIDRDNMGHFDPNANHVVQDLPGALHAQLGNPAYFNGDIYYATPGFGTDNAKEFSIANGVLSTSPVSKSTDTFTWRGGTVSISANGTSNGIVWALDGGSNQLRAYSAANLGTELYTSAQAANNRDQLGAVVKFTVPTVTNGHVYVGVNGALVGYGPLGTPVATSLAFTQQPTNGETGATLTPAVTVAVRDQFGNTFTGDSSSTVTVTLSSGTFVGGGNTATATVSAGVATFANLALSAPGTYTLAATDGSLTGATSQPFTIQTPARLAFTQQPGNGVVGAPLTPPVAVAVEDAGGNTVTGDSSTVTLTLSSGTFAGGSNTATASAVHGVATFGGLVINTAGTYTLAAGDGTLTGATSNAFTITTGTSVYDDFNAAATDFTSNFTVHNNNGATNNPLAWGATLGVNDQAGGAAGGGVESSGSVAIDSTAIYTPSKVNLGDGQVHLLSEYVTAVSGLGTGDKSLQLGFLSPTSVGFNAGNNFISARILGNDTVEFQSANGGGAVSTNNTTPTGAINPGDWLDLIFTTQETASGSFKGTFALIDYGPAGVGAGTTVLAPVSYSVTGLTGLGTASAVAPGWRTATPATFSGHVRWDNFAVDPPPPAKLAYLQQPASGSAGTPLGPFVVAVEDLGGHTVSTDASTVTLTLSHGTFANGATSVTAPAANGVATFRNLVINVPGSYTLAASDGRLTGATSGSFTINAAGASKVAFVQQPSNASAGATISPAVTVAVEDANGNTVTTDTSTVTLTLSSGTFAGGSNTATASAVHGVATFGSLVINTAGSYTLAASDGSLTGATSSSFTISAGSSFNDTFNTGATDFTSKLHGVQPRRCQQHQPGVGRRLRRTGPAGTGGGRRRPVPWQCRHRHDGGVHAVESQPRRRPGPHALRVRDRGLGARHRR